MESEHRTVGVEVELLASATRRGESPTDERLGQGRRLHAALHDPRVGRVHLGNAPTERSLLEEGAGCLDLENLRHLSRRQLRSARHLVSAGQGSAPCRLTNTRNAGADALQHRYGVVMAPWSAPEARRAYLARKPRV